MVNTPQCRITNVKLCVPQVQQELCRPGALERYLNDEEVKLCRSVFTGLYSLDMVSCLLPHCALCCEYRSVNLKKVRQVFSQSGKAC